MSVIEDAVAKELALARSRLADQEKRLLDCGAVLSAAKSQGMQALVVITSKKMERLAKEVNSTRQAIESLGKLVGDTSPSSQIDVETQAPAAPLKKGR